MKRSMFTMIAAIGALTATGANAMQPQDPACLTASQADAMIVTLMPSVIREITKLCTPALTETAYLRTKGDSLARRFADEAARTRPAALAAFERLAGDDKVMRNVKPETLAQMMEEAVAPEITGSLKVKDCPGIDRMIGYLDPLPPRNISGLFVTVLEMSEEKPTKGNRGRRASRDSFTICPAAGG